MYSQDTSQPPSYESCVAALQEPVLLVLAGQSIRAGSATGPALYETNRGVANLGPATTCVELTRVERSVRRGGAEEATLTTDEDAKEFGEVEAEDGDVLVTPRVRVRRRHIMDLVHPTSSGTPPYYVKPWTKQTQQGTWGLKKAYGLRRWRVLRVLEKGRYGEPAFVDEEEEERKRPLFCVGKAHGGAYEWTDAHGERLAREEQDRGKKEYSLTTVRAMGRDEMDALVAMWCCRIWEAAAAAQPPIHEGMEKGKRNKT
ncbi:hypothetical protein A9K55_001845 [Cordyceps militaris]|uniref:Uncharacterized protein n=1 Tax=Cordyceps militaris TaxID=73501 RepID=A0A2H4SRM9_CORMI|nr:hypothetical protein A9K55_001845 [Cordyceps militaris]